MANIDEKLKKEFYEVHTIIDDLAGAFHNALSKLDTTQKILLRLEELKMKEVKKSFVDYAWCRNCRFLEIDVKGYFCVVKNRPTERNLTCAQFRLNKREVGEDGEKRD